MRERLKQERIKKLKRAFFIFISLAGIFLLVFLRIMVPKYFHHLSIFKVRKIVVEPAVYQPLMSAYVGNVMSENILFLDLNPIYNTIKKCYFVENCSLKKILPGTLLINLSLRIPLFEVIDGDKFALMDKDGYFLPFDSNFKGWVVKGMQVGSIGEKSTDDEKLKILLKIERWYNYYNIGNLFQADTVSLENLEKIKMSGREGDVFLYPKNFKRKFEQLQIVLETCKKENFPFKYIDLRFNQPYVEKKQK
ncbi:MAG: hypothetical protein M1135_01440 [Candidatus Omnitrophica bacterium]|nr:hypothetical protein [Candidatus Omnitrophota bacterium]